LLVCLVVAAPSGAYLSIFGADSNDGLSASTAVKTLARAYSVMQQQSWSVIYVMPGSYPLTSLTVTGSFALIGSQNQPGLTKFSCQSGQASLSTGNANTNISFDSISFESCAQVVTLGVYSSNSNYVYQLKAYNVLWTQNTKDIVAQGGYVNIFVSNSRFESGKGNAISLYHYTSQFSSVSVTMDNVKFTDYALTALDFTGSSVNQLAVNITTATFTGGGSFINMASAAASLTANLVAFVGGVSNGCGINLMQGCVATINKASFINKSGGPSMCVSGGSTATVQNTEFLNNTISSKSFTGAGGAVFVGGGSTFAVANSNFRQNTLDVGEGGGIHCVMSHLTVAQSTFSYNQAPDAAAASCLNCVLVAYGNQVYSNTGSSTDACSL